MKLSFKFCVPLQLHARGHLKLKEKKIYFTSQLLRNSNFYHTTIKSSLHPIMLIQSINHHTFLCYTKPSIGVDNHSLHQSFTDTAPLQPPWWGDDRPCAGHKDQSWVSCHHPCISATNSSERRKYFTELVNLSHTKKKQLAVCQMSWIMWSLDYQIDALATIDAEDIIFQAQLKRKNRWIDWQTFP